MVKVKAKSSSEKIINFAIFLMRGQETISSANQAYHTRQDEISYSEIQSKCCDFLAARNQAFQFNLYIPDIHNFQEQINIKLQPNDSFRVRDIMQKMNGNLIIIIKSAYEELKYDLYGQINMLRQQLTQLKQIVQQFKPLKQNIQLLRKNSTSVTPLMLTAHSMVQKDYQHLELDIAILISQPLFDDEKKKQTMTAVDFRSQLSRLNVALQSSFKANIIMRCEIATIQSLKNIIKFSKPKILHIVCHGNAQGFLQFEDDSRNTLGVLQLVKPEDIKIILKNYLDCLPDLVFVNSCHSENVGKAFYQIGVKYVIGINSEDLINDEAAQIFSQNFYRNIFRGETVMQSFSLAKKKVQIHHGGGCCCFHGSSQPHKQNCRWLKLQKRNPTAHKDYHIPSSKCECSLRNLNRHAFTCQWAKKVLFQINDDFRIPEQNNPNQFRFPWHTSQFPDYIDKTKKQFFICCCPVKDRKPHSQSNKFLIMSKDQGKQSLFKILHNRDKAQITDLTPIQLVQAHEKSKSIFGRNRQLFQFLKMVKQVNFLVVYGKSGVGLTNFSVKASTYMMERHVFSFFFFIDLYDIKDEVVFRYKFNQITKFQYNGKTIDEIGMKNKKILFLFDNCDYFINSSSVQNEFYKQIQTILRQLPRSKIIITYKQQTNKVFDDKKILCKKFQLTPFQSRAAICFLNSKLKDKTDISVGYSEFSKLLKQYPVLKIPKVVQSLAQSFSESQKKIKYQQIEKNVKAIQVSDTNKLTEQILLKLKQKSIETYQFLIFISQFSDGVTFEDLNMFSLYASKDMTVQLPIKKNWEDQYRMLFDNQGLKEQQKKQDDEQQPKLATTVSHTDVPGTYSNSQTLNIGMIKKISETAKSNDSNLKYQFEDIKQESYFVDKNGKGKFIVKRFIRDFVWNKHQNQTTFQMKFLYVAYFSVILKMLFALLRKQKYFHEDLISYSALSTSGIFSLGSTLEELYDKTDMTKSTRVAKSFISDLDSMFIKNQQLIQKIKNTDPSIFIMNHRHDFLKIYDYKWSDVFNYFKSKNKQEQKIFLIFLQNLLIYIPTALKLAKAQDSLLRYCLRSSLKQLLKIRVVSIPERSFLNQLKIHFIQIGLNLQSDQQINQPYTKCTKLTQQFSLKILKKQPFQQYCSLYQQQILSLSLIKDLSIVKTFERNDIFHLMGRYQQFAKGFNNFLLDPIIKSKQALLMSLIFLKFIKKNQVQKMTILNSADGHSFLQTIKDLCTKAAQVFDEQYCIKLKLKAMLTSLELEWESNYSNQNFDNSQSASYEEVDKCLSQIIECENIYLNNANKLRGFTEFDSKIKEMKILIKGKLWKKVGKRIIFMKAFPLASKENYPIIKNLVRKKNNFRKQIEKVLKQPRLQILFSERKISGMGAPSPILKPKQTRIGDRKIKLDISTKYQILTQMKIQQQAKARCSIMYLTVDVKIQNGNVYFVCQNQIMGQQFIEIDQQLGQSLNFDNILILILAGSNTFKAMQKIAKVSKKPPIIIALNSEPIEHYDQIDYSHDFDAQSIRQLIRKQNQVKYLELVYTKHFMSVITQSQISKNQQIKQIHQLCCQKLNQFGSKSVTPYIYMHSSSKQIYLKYNEGNYRDLSPGYEGNHNIDQKYYESNVLMRRWRKMTQFFKFINQHRLELKHYSQSQQTSDLFLSIVGDASSGWKQSNSNGTAYINVYGENGSGKTFFIREVAKILVQRQFYNFGVFLFEGKKIQNYYGGDFQAYIKKQSSLSRMPNLEDFQRLLSWNTILIVDDFHLIKPRVNARMKIFMDKILSKKVNLILVSVNELKLQFIPKMKKIKLQVLDNFETEIIAYNILNVNNPEQISAFEKLKQNSKLKNKPILIKDIDECKKGKKNNPDKNQDPSVFHIGEIHMKKATSTFG